MPSRERRATDPDDPGQRPGNPFWWAPFPVVGALLLWQLGNGEGHRVAEVLGVAPPVWLAAWPPAGVGGEHPELLPPDWLPAAAGWLKGSFLAVGSALFLLLLVVLRAVRPSAAHPTGAATPRRGADHQPAGGPDGRTRPPGGAWLTGADFAVLAGEPAPALWGEFLEEGSVTLIPAVPKSGKSVLGSGLCGALVAGSRAFLGRPVRPIFKGGEPVVAMAEETPRIFRHKALRMAGLEARSLSRWGRLWWRVRRRFRRAGWGRPDIYVLSGPLAGPKDTEHIREHLLAGGRKCLEVGARLLWVDSVKHWCPDAISQDAAAGVLMDAAKEVAAMSHSRGRLKGHNLAVALVHHLRDKGDNEMLGPTTLWSQADFRLPITPPKGMGVTETTLRQIVPEGRFDGLAPEPVRYRMREDGSLAAVGGRPAAPAPAAPAAPAPETPPAPAVEAPGPVATLEHPQTNAPPQTAPEAAARAPVAVEKPKRDTRAEGRAAVVAWLEAQADRSAWVPIAQLVAAAPGGLKSTALQARLQELRLEGGWAEGREWRKHGKGLEYRLPPRG